MSDEELNSLQKIEAEWVTQELNEFVKLIQQYRVLYLSAVFLSLGWVLGQLIGSQGIAVNSDSGANQATALDILSKRTDIALVLCFVPLVNLLFGLLSLEAIAQIQSLARYRFILGWELGDQAPVWRWELWKSSKFGSTRIWTTPLNIFTAVFILILSGGALSFAYPGVFKSGSPLLVSLWIIALVATVATVIAAGLWGMQNREKNDVATSPGLPETWTEIYKAHRVKNEEPEQNS